MPPEAPPRARGNLVFLGLSQAFRLGAGFAINILVMRWLGVEGFGIYGYVTTLVGLFSFLSIMGMDQLIKREIARDADLIGRYVAGGLIATTLLSLLTAGAVVGWAWVTDGRAIVVGAAALGTLALGLRSLTMIPVAAFHGVRRMGLGVTGHIVGRVVLVAASALALWRGLEVVGLFGAQVLEALITLSVIAAIFWRRIGTLSLAGGVAEVRPLLRRSLPFGLNALFGSVYLSVDVLMLQHMRGEAEVGAYRAAAMVIALLPLVADTITTGIFPRMAQFLGKPEEAGRELLFVTRVLLAISLPAAVGALVLAEPLMVLLGGEAFAVSALPFIVMAPMLPLRFLKNAFGMTLSSLNRQEDRTRGTLFAAIFNIAANLYAIPRYGAVGAAVTTLITDILLLLWLQWRVRPLVSGYRIGGVVLRASLPAAAMGGVLLLLPGLHVLAAVGLGAVVFGLLALVTRAWHPRDLSRLRRV